MFNRRWKKASHIAINRDMRAIKWSSEPTVTKNILVNPAELKFWLCVLECLRRGYRHLEHIGLKDELHIVVGQTKQEQKCKQRFSCRVSQRYWGAFSYIKLIVIALGHIFGTSIELNRDFVTIIPWWQDAFYTNTGCDAARKNSYLRTVCWY